MGERSEYHKTAVRAPHDDDPRCVEFGLSPDPVETAADVADAVVALVGIVEFQPGLAVAARTADVGMNDRQAQLVQIELLGPVEEGPVLALGPAVDVDDHPCRSILRRGARFEIVCGNFATV